MFLVTLRNVCAWGCMLMAAGMTAVQIDAQELDSRELTDLRVIGQQALQQQQLERVKQVADAIVKQHDDPQATLLAGDLYLRSGHVQTAIQQFERFLSVSPAARPELWQYGVALAIAGRYEDGKKLFEVHRTVNPHDVENAAWHFLCVAKLAGMDEARRLILPAPHDPRVPMEELRGFFVNRQRESIEKAVAALPEGTRQREEALFYANLYQGLEADAAGDAKQAIEYLKRTTGLSFVNYMTDVSRVYLESLQRAAAQPKTDQ